MKIAQTMLGNFRFFFVLISILLLTCEISAATADLILMNGKIITVDSNDTISQAIAIRDGKIAAIRITLHTQCDSPACKIAEHLSL